ncbi:hypothetical protein D3C87_1096970 [compost metagenome]
MILEAVQLFGLLEFGGPAGHLHEGVPLLGDVPLDAAESDDEPLLVPDGEDADRDVALLAIPARRLDVLDAHGLAGLEIDEGVPENGLVFYVREEADALSEGFSRGPSPELFGSLAPEGQGPGLGVVGGDGVLGGFDDGCERPGIRLAGLQRRQGLVSVVLQACERDDVPADEGEREDGRGEKGEEHADGRVEEADAQPLRPRPGNDGGSEQGRREEPAEDDAHQGFAGDGLHEAPVRVGAEDAERENAEE